MSDERDFEEDEILFKPLSELPEWKGWHPGQPFPEGWSFSKGGMGLKTDQHSISYTEELPSGAFRTTFYLLPLQVTALVSEHERNARETLQRDMRMLLGV